MEASIVLQIGSNLILPHPHVPATLFDAIDLACKKFISKAIRTPSICVWSWHTGAHNR